LGSHQPFKSFSKGNSKALELEYLSQSLKNWDPPNWLQKTSSSLFSWFSIGLGILGNRALNSFIQCNKEKVKFKVKPHWFCSWLCDHTVSVDRKIWWIQRWNSLEMQHTEYWENWTKRIETFALETKEMKNWTSKKEVPDRRKIHLLTLADQYKRIPDRF